ncbi:MAG: NAD(P)H-dependent oxidoreductase [Flavobacteriales bacterium]|nr:NAD(P)H-dependent oxidoreductase [Flavobacteriales bacterium]
MKTILAISGSASPGGSNAQLLQVISTTFAHSYSIQVLEELWELPLYTPELEHAGIPEKVQLFREAIGEADAVIICTPEYVHNIPAVLKNAIEWVTTSGEISEKPVLPITFSPAPPRGEYAMISLLQSLRACNAKLVAELPLYRNELTLPDGTIGLDEAHHLLLTEALALL